MNINLEKVREVKEQALKFVMPTEEEIREQRETIERLKSCLVEVLEEKGVPYVEVEAHGSTGIKQTQLRGASDIDIFVEIPITEYQYLLRMNRRERASEIRKIFEELVENCFKRAAERAGCKDIVVAYAEHPYLSAKYGRFDVDIVGCFSISPEALRTCGPLTAVDRTPHHSRFIRDSLTPEQKNEVRLLKAFFRASHAYGDKSAVGRCGFTGYSAELPIYHYGSLENVFLNFDRLPSEPIDFFGRGKEELRKNPRFEKDFLIIIDPVDPNRNAAASIDERAYLHVCRRIKEFLRSPSAEFFVERPIEPLNPAELSAIGNRTVVVEFSNVENTHYVFIRDKLYKLARQISKILEREETGETRFGKTLFEVYFENERIFAVAFLVERANISKFFERRGPPVWAREHVERFLEKHRDAYVRGEYYYVTVERKYTDPLPLVSDLIRAGILERLSLQNLKVISISRYGATDVGKKAIAVIVRYILPLYESAHREKS